jgi:hypothetical protein
MQSAVAAPASTARRPWRRRLKKIALGVGVALPLVIGVLWWAVHRFDWAGPMLANGLRSVIGSANVTSLEDFSYAVEDRINRWFRKDEKPKAYWTVPSHAAPAPPAGSATSEAKLPPFHPAEPGPVHKSWSAPGDGVWVPIADPRRPGEEPYLMKTLLHPDENRSWAELFVVAADLRRVRVHVMAGTQEPKADTPEGEKIARTGVIPASDHEELLGAFNGGFMTEHGGWGMRVGGVTLVKPRDKGCTVAVYEDDSVTIATWSRIKDTVGRMRWYRQGPECMFEDDTMHRGLSVDDNPKWGATLDGDTVIRRSAVAINASRNVLYVGISNHTNARVMADGMHHLGAPVVVQMDVNWSYPKFVLFEPKPGDTKRMAVALAPGFEFSEDEYIRQKARRDFFYLTRLEPTAAPPAPAPSASAVP